MRKIFALISTLFFLTTFSAKAEVQYGFGLMAGQISSDGTETEGTAADTSNRSKSFEEAFFGADLFLEVVNDSGLTFGISYVPVDFELGSGKRVDTAVAATAGGAENDTGTRTASAELSNLITAYTNIPISSNGLYTLLGVHMATVETTETLNTESYGDEDIFGAQIGLGVRNGNIKYELAYSDFEDIKISSSGGANSVSADADVLSLRLSYAF